MKRLSLMSPDEIRDLLAEQYLWDVENMANDHRISIHELTGLLQCGGDAWRKKNAAPEPEQLKSASFDVVFSPMVNVRACVKDPRNLTEAEQDRLIELARNAVSEQFNEIISCENLSMIRLYDEEGKEEPQYHYIVGEPEYDAIDPEILVEVTNNIYEHVYHVEEDGVVVSRMIVDFARKLTVKYRNTDWLDGEHDFWLTMEEECDRFLKERYGASLDEVDDLEPQPKREWTKEEKEMWNRIHSILGQAADSHAFSTTTRLIGDKECVKLQDFIRKVSRLGPARGLEETE